MSSEERNPWDRRDDETAAQWHAFTCYLNLGKGRSLVKAWKVYANERDLKGEHPSSSFKEWSSSNDWVLRVEHYDAHEDEQRRLIRETARERARDRLVEKLDDAVDTLIAAALAQGDGKKVTHAQLRALENLLDRAGVTEPASVALELSGRVDRRHEITGPGGESLFAHLDDAELDSRISQLEEIVNDAGQDDVSRQNDEG